MQSNNATRTREEAVPAQSSLKHQTGTALGMLRSRACGHNSTKEGDGSHTGLGTSDWDTQDRFRDCRFPGTFMGSVCTQSGEDPHPLKIRSNWVQCCALQSQHWRLRWEDCRVQASLKDSEPVSNNDHTWSTLEPNSAERLWDPGNPDPKGRGTPGSAAESGSPITAWPLTHSPAAGCTCC